MARVPGSFNGGIPPNLKWEDKPTKFACSDDLRAHANECDGKCERIPISFMEMELINENREWARIGMDPDRIVSGNPTKTDLVLRALIEVLEVDEIALNEKYRELRLRMMKAVRLANQDNLKREMLGLGPKIIGPDGQPL